MKVAVGADKVTALRFEAQQYGLISEHLRFAGIQGSWIDKELRFGALLIAPVGEKKEPTADLVKKVLDSLRSVALTGWSHGDARWANVVWTSDTKPLWVDVRTVVDQAALLGDVRALARSLGVPEDRLRDLDGKVERWEVEELARALLQGRRSQ